MTTESTSDVLRRRIENDFKFHPADEARGRIHDSIREELYGAGLFLTDACPEGRELSLALTKLEEAMFWANAAIARQA